MKNIFAKMVSLALALLLCVLPLLAQAESQLQARMAQVYESYRPIEAVVTLELDDSLSAYNSPEEFEMMQKLLRASELKVFVKRSVTEVPELGLELSIQGMAIVDGYAWLGERGLHIVTSLLPGKVLLYNDQELTKILGEQMEELNAQAESFQAIASGMEKYVAIAYQWMNETQGLVTLGEKSTPGTERRDPAAASMDIRVTPDQLKALLVMLAEEFARDHALKELLGLSGDADDGSTEDEGKQLLAAVKELVPTNKDMTWQAFTDSSGALVGLDGLIPAMFGADGGEGSITYDRLTANEGKKTTHSLIGKLAGKEGGISAIRLETAKDLGDPAAPKDEFLLWLHFQESADHGTADFKINHSAESVLEADREKLTSQTDISLENKPGKGGLLSQSDAMDLLIAGTDDVSIRVDFASDARLLGEEDFTCESKIELTLLGITLGRLGVRLTSESDYFMNTSDMELVQIAELDDAGVKALDKELEDGFNAAVTRFVSVLPPELLQMMQGTDDSEVR